ncbi:MAG: class I SAM-dependent methyltransferase [Gammaproteobacteria bacterium]|nr:class I SAM-dependent methyltransferase [Gammaproteobacteria bacterium]
MADSLFRHAADRAAGYVTDIGYSHAYHPELNPLATRLAFLRAGLEPPRIATACELGFGQGVSLAIHAAATPVRWWGCDLLPGHVRFAQSLDAASGAGAVLAEATFEEFAACHDLPAFDFIGLHGVLSWVSAGNRAVIARFIGERLAPGGVVYTSCNTLAGWADMLALRPVMAAYASRAATGPTLERIAQALDFTARLLDANPVAARALPGLRARFERLQAASPSYLAHEYFNRDWQPFGFVELAALLAGAGLQFAGSCALRDRIDAFAMTAGQRALMGTIGDTVLRETVREFVTGTSVRRDYWVATPRRLADEALAAAWRATRMTLTVRPDEVAERVSGALGEARLDEPAHRAVIRTLAGAGAETIGGIAAHAGLDEASASAAVFELAAFGFAAVAQEPAVVAARREPCERLNAHLRRLGDEGAAIGVVADPVTGGGVRR